MHIIISLSFDEDNKINILNIRFYEIVRLTDFHTIPYLLNI